MMIVVIGKVLKLYTVCGSVRGRGLNWGGEDRPVAFNGEWDAFQRFRRQPSPHERYHTPYPDTLPDIVALKAAA